MIEGVRTKKLKFVCDDRGRLMEILRKDDDLFAGFGQVYITTAYPGVVKAWHYHKKQDDNFCVVNGAAKVVLYDMRDNSSTRGEINEFVMGDVNPMLLQIPRNVYHGFMCLGETEMILMNCPTEPFNGKEPDEYRMRADSAEIPYKWDVKFK